MLAAASFVPHLKPLSFRSQHEAAGKGDGEKRHIADPQLVFAGNVKQRFLRIQCFLSLAVGFAVGRTRCKRFCRSGAIPHMSVSM